MNNLFTLKKTFPLVLLCMVTNVSSSELAPFTSDGCSAFPDGTIVQNKLWLACCVEHDMAYWKGGSYQERLTADDQLHACVANVGEPTIAKLMLAGVSVGGTPYLPTLFRWGYGWPFMRGYKLLEREEQVLVDAAMNLYIKNINQDQM